MVKKTIAADFWKNKSIFAAAISAADQSDQKNSGISASTPRAETVETSDHNGAPMKHTALPRAATTKNSDPYGKKKHQH